MKKALVVAGDKAKWRKAEKQTLHRGDKMKNAIAIENLPLYSTRMRSPF